MEENSTNSQPQTDRLDKLEQSLSQLTDLVTKLVTQPKPKKKTAKKKKVVKPRKSAKMAMPTNTQDAPVKSSTPGGVISLVNRATTAIKSPNAPQGRGKSSRQCRQEPINITPNRPNLFLKDPTFSAHKDDVKKDKILSGNLTPTPRRNTVQQYEVACIKCGKLYIVTESEFFIDPDDQSVNYTCNNCVTSNYRPGND